MNQIKRVSSLQCEYYDNKECKENGKCKNEIENCDDENPSGQNHCFVLWKDNVVRLKGCSVENVECSDDKCIDHEELPLAGIHICCCNGDFCNRQFEWKYEPV